MNIFIVSPNTVFLSGLTSLLESNSEYTVINTVDSIDGLITCRIPNLVDVVLIDECFLTEYIIEKTVAYVSALFKKAKVIGMIKSFNDYKILKFENNGIFRFINYAMGPQEIINQINSRDTDDLDKAVIGAKTWNNKLTDLTTEEIYIIEQLCINKKKSEMARELRLTERTFGYYVERIKKKTNSHDIKNLIFESVKKGFPTNTSRIV